MKAILGRLSDLGLRELFKLLTTAGAEGTLEVEAPVGPARISIRAGHVAGDLTPALVLAHATRSGTFCFRPQPVPEDAGEWLPQEEFLARLDSQVQFATRAAAAAGMSAQADERKVGADPLAELRDSLAEVSLPSSAVRMLVLSADPRPYRTLMPEWRQRGWEVTVSEKPSWPEGPAPALAIVHLPASGTLAAQGQAWLGLLDRARNERPPVPVVWVGGLGDPWLRHQVIMAGADFVMPAPAGEIGETARWFRDELTLVVERLLARRAEPGGGAAEAFRDFFLALHVDAPPAEARASLLRFAGTFFRRGVLFAIRDNGFESVGGYGFALGSPVRLSRGGTPLEDVVVERRPLDCAGMNAGAVAGIAKALRSPGGLNEAKAFPILGSGECLAVFVGDSPVAASGDAEMLAAVLARSGGLLGL